MVIPQTEYVIPYDIVTSDLDDVVGGKNAHIAEIRNRLGIAVPEGFAITTRAYQCFLDHNQLQAPLSEILSDWQAGRIALDAASAKLLDRFAASTLPPPLTRAIKRALKPLQQKMAAGTCFWPCAAAPWERTASTPLPASTAAC
nr:PEP/pyruvate-binding domain-containing protein [Desulfosarcina cetonica]